METFNTANDKIQFSRYTKDFVRRIQDLVFQKIRPVLIRISNTLQSSDTNQHHGSVDRICKIYNLCCDQIRKSILILFEILKNVNDECCSSDLESLQSVYERLSYCHQKLLSIEEHTDQVFNAVGIIDKSEDSLLMDTMYFVNWIDQTFEVLNDLSKAIYVDCKLSEEAYNNWKDEIIKYVSGIHICVDELLLSALTLCKYCLPSDQHVVKARCQVVLRETKTLFNELIVGDFDSVFQATYDTLRLPIKPSNVNVLIDVLKDVLYALETNTNTALLALLLHCFSHSTSPVDSLKEHFTEKSDECPCGDKENCDYVKEFDIYNERLMQIGSFAISCSSDENRVLSLRSGLASLEALDPHLVPAIMVSPHSYHASLLIDIWKRELADIRNNVFLIVDPSAFTQKARQMLHEKLLDVVKSNTYDNVKVCSVINIGCIVNQFFDVYKTMEPDALNQQEKLLPLIDDLNKVQLECKIVCNILSCGNDFVYPTKKSSKECATFDQLLKRLKLLYTIVNRVSTLLGPGDNDDQLFEEQSEIKNETHTVNNFRTYVNSPRKTVNITRSIFGRTTNLRSSTAKFPLAALTNKKARKELSFSIKLDELCTNDMSDIVKRNTSILYNSPIKNRSSLRKAGLNRHCLKSFELDLDQNSEMEESALDDVMSLQITDVLNEINNLTIPTRKHPFNLTYGVTELDFSNTLNSHPSSKAVEIPVHKETVTKCVWNITVNNDLTGNNDISNVSQPSNIDTLERISDINVVTSKLSDLRCIEFETSL